jgi:hypothetical protein
MPTSPTNLDQADENARFSHIVPFEFAREHLLLPVERTVDPQGNPTIRCLAASNRHSSQQSSPAVDNLSLLLGAHVQLALQPESTVQEAIRQAYQDQMAQQGMQEAR